MQSIRPILAALLSVPDALLPPSGTVVVAGFDVVTHGRQPVRGEVLRPVFVRLDGRTEAILYPLSPGDDEPIGLHDACRQMLAGLDGLSGTVDEDEAE